MAVTDAARWAYELHRCEQDFLYLASRHLRIKSKHTIGLPTLKLNRVQRFLHERKLDMLKRTGWVRLIIGKARQVGTTTYFRADSFHQTAFMSHRNSFFLNYDEPHTQEVFDEMDLAYFDALPPQLKPRVKYRSKQKLEFEDRNSKILANHARNPSVGASGMTHYLHLTEAARYPNADQIQASLFPTMSEARGKEYSTMVIESTSRYGGDWFREMADQAIAGKSIFEFVFVPWWMHEAYRLPVPKDFRLTSEERYMIAEYKMEVENIVWWRMKQQEYSSNITALLQEYPLDWNSSWQLPRDTSQTFSNKVLEGIDRDLCPGMMYTFDKDGPHRAFDGMVEVWRLPEDGCFYDIGVDQSGGETEKSDYSVMVVVRRDTLEQVAQCRGRFNPASTEFLNTVYWTGMVYNRAQIAVDKTGGWGHALIKDLQGKAYPNIYQQRVADSSDETITTRMGFSYSHGSKKHLVTNAVKLVTREKPVIHSDVLMDEMRNFLTIGIDQWGAGPGKYDDAVNAYMLALMSATEEGRLGKEAADDREETITKPWAQHDIDADLNEPTFEHGQYYGVPEKGVAWH